MVWVNIKANSLAVTNTKSKFLSLRNINKIKTKCVCGSWKNGRDLQEGLEDIANIEKNSVDDYLRNNLHLRLTDSLLFAQWNKKLLIENRIGHPDHSTDKICPYHQFRLGIGYQPSTQSAHPLHEKSITGKKGVAISKLSLPTTSIYGPNFKKSKMFLRGNFKMLYRKTSCVIFLKEYLLFIGLKRA